MWKKLGVVCISLICTFSVVYALNSEMSASSSIYNSGGNVTGRINQKPSNLIVANGNTSIGLQKGDKISTGLGTGWLLMDYQSYNTYDCVSNRLAISITCPTNQPVIQSWMAMSTNAIADSDFGLSTKDFYKGMNGTSEHGEYTKTKIAASLTDFNNKLNNSVSDKSLIAYRNWSKALEMFNIRNKGSGNKLMADVVLNATSNLDENGKSAFSPFYLVEYDNLVNKANYLNDMLYETRNFKFETGYWTSYISNTTTTKYSVMEITAQSGGAWTQNSAITPAITRGIRPSVYIDTKDIVFAVSQGSGNAFGKVSEPKLKSSYTSLFDDMSIYSNMKPRILDSNYQVTFNGINNKDNQSITKTGKDSVITLDISSNNYNNSTISVLFLDKATNQFKYYKPLGDAGSANYSITLSGIDVGKYDIAVVNEAYDDTSSAASYSSLISDVISLEVIDPLDALNHVPTHGANLSDFYATGPSGNVKTLDKMATLSSLNGVGNTVAENRITYALQPSSDSKHANDYTQFNIPTTGGKPTLDNGKPYVVANPTSGGYLTPGVYKYRIQAYDANGDPYGAQLNDGTPVSGITPDQGLITEDIVMVVYPHDSQLTFDQLNNTATNVRYTKKELNALSSGTQLGTITFDKDADISVLQADGYNILDVKLVKQGTTTPLSELEAQAVSGDINKFHIKKKNGANFTSDISFDILVTFENAGTNTAILRKSSQKFEVPAGLSFVDPDTSAFITSGSYEYTWDESNSAGNTFVMKATDNASANVTNAKVEYCILDASNACTNSSTVINFILGASAGTQKIEVLAPGTTDKKVKIRAMTKDGNGDIVMSSDLGIIIHPAKQILTWEGTNIQESGNDIKKDALAHNTWTLSLKYDKDTASNNEHTSAEIIKGITLTDKVITLRDEVESGTATTITYTYTSSAGAVDDGKVTIINNKLVISGELQGDVTITATAAATGNYRETSSDDPSTPTINEDESAYLVLSVSSKAKVKYTQSYTGDIDTSSDEATGNAPLGELTIDPSSETGYTFAIESVKQLDKVASTPDNEVYNDMGLAGINKFQIKAEGSPVKQNLYVNTATPLPAGKYIVKVKGTNGNEKATSEEITIIIDEAEMDVSKIKWVQKDKASDTYTNITPIAGQIDTTTKINTGTQEKTYSNVNGVEGTFYVNVENKNDTILTGATIEYSLSLDSTAGVITVLNNGLVTMKRATKTGDVVYVLATIKKSGYKDLEVKLPIKINKGISNFEFVDQLGTPYAVPTPPNNDGDPYIYSPLLNPASTQNPKEAYSFVKDKKLDVMTANAPANTAVKISIVDKGASKGNDVLKFDDLDSNVQSNQDTATKVCEISASDYAANRTSACLVQIQHALNKYKGSGSDLNKIVIVAEIAESDNYKAKRLEMPVNIMPAKQTDFDFLEQTLPLDSTTSFTSVSPTFQPTSANSSTGKIELMVDDPNGTDVADRTKIKLAKPNGNPDYVDGIDSIDYNILVDKNGIPNEEIVTIYAVKEGDRDYYESDVKQQDWVIAREGTSRLKLNIYSYPDASDPSNVIKDSVTYGDAYFRVEGSTSTDKDDPDNLPTYTYVIDTSSTDYIEPYGSDGDKFKPLKVGSGDQIVVIVTRKQNGQSDITRRVSITIKKRPVKLKVDDITKKSGMSVDTSEYQFTSTSENFLASDLADIEIKFTCQDVNAVDVTALPDGVRKEHDQLPIKAKVTNKVPTKDVLSNYLITYLDGKTAGIEQGKLIVTEDESQKSWYDIKAGKIDPTTDTVLGMNGWYNGPVDVELKAVAGDYDQIALEDLVEAWATNFVTTTKEGSNVHDIYFRKSTTNEEGAITKVAKETIKIDTIDPEVTSIKATITHNDAFSKFIHTITFGAFMKPGEEVTIKTKDVQANPAIDVSTTNSITDGILYNVYTTDTSGNRDIRVVSDGLLDTDANGTATFTIANPGVYEVCAVVKDQATNESVEKCEKFNVKKIGIDVDGDGKPDFNDPDGDGCPDIDIVLTDKNGNTYKINGDRDGDGVPDMNIDSDGDGIADINVDTDNDKKPDLNLVILSKTDWKPTTCITSQSDEYCTTKGIKPIINIDTDKDNIPDIDIDNVGDFKPHLNISKDGKTPSLNIVELHEWKPNQDYKKGADAYDSIGTGDGEPKPELNIDTNGDGNPDVNIDFDNDGKEDINIDTNGDGIPDVDIDINGDGKPDVNIDTNGDGKADKEIVEIKEWKPDFVGDKDGFVFDTMSSLKGKGELEDNGVKVEKPGGSFLPNFALKVTDVTKTLDTDITDKIKKQLDKNQEIKNTYDVSLWKDNAQVQPDGTLRVKIPYDQAIKNPSVIIELADGTFKKVDAKIEDGFLIYESDYLGKVSVIGDLDTTSDDTKTPPTDNGNSDNSSIDTSVKGTYTGNPIGGALTGDTQKTGLYITGICIAIGLILVIRKTFHEEE